MFRCQGEENFKLYFIFCVVAVVRLHIGTILQIEYYFLYIYSVSVEKLFVILRTSVWEFKKMKRIVTFVYVCQNDE